MGKCDHFISCQSLSSTRGSLETGAFFFLMTYEEVLQALEYLGEFFPCYCSSVIRCTSQVRIGTMFPNVHHYVSWNVIDKFYNPKNFLHRWKPTGYLHIFAKDFCRLAALKFRHVCHYPRVGRQQILRRLQHLGWVFGCRQQFGGPLPHLDFMVDLLLKIMILENTKQIGL